MKDCDICRKHHRLHIRRRAGQAKVGEAREVVVVRGGRLAYLSLTAEPNPVVGPQIILSGAATLRKVALAILAEVGRKGRSRG